AAIVRTRPKDSASGARETFRGTSIVISCSRGSVSAADRWNCITTESPKPEPPGAERRSARAFRAETSRQPGGSGVESRPQQRLDLMLVLPSRGGPRSAPQFQLIRPDEERMNARDAREVQDPAAIHPHESRRIQPAFQFREALVQQVPPRATAQLNIIVGGFDPVDGIARDEVEAVSISDHNALRPLARANRAVPAVAPPDPADGALRCADRRARRFGPAAYHQRASEDNPPRSARNLSPRTRHKPLKMTVAMRSGPTRSTTCRPVQSCNCTSSSE